MRDNSWLSEIIQKQTEEFLAKGGKIQVFPLSHSPTKA
jgi:hypothetical protein